PHQKAIFFSPGSEGLIEQLHGKQLSYNNYLDINAALKLIYRFDKPTAAIFKHTNPCGVASAADLLTAYKNSFATDTQSPFGGIVILNKPLDMETAQEINKIFTEIIIAPEFSPEIIEFLTKKKDRRIIKYNPLLLENWSETPTFVSCLNGVLCQDIDIKQDAETEWKIVTEKSPSEEEYNSLRFCWNVVTSLKSNAICLGRGEQTIGMGMGQTSRIDSTVLAVFRAEKYNHQIEGAVCASDGFFPFPDVIQLLAKKGIKAIIQPGGSKGDEEVIKACNDKGISMIFTGCRHFAH
ncbi:MAG: bifunctional phosphoribosylaminoimidazolecarboxamide formyltransferase/IMP cyclohydrolase, partial [Candidatus Cloacimonetes bacterium]|nr:bifunctional phosphoribosylaminoimidazolecarboxamide formyltransferase/IMP cyclohydrolase [Candidatus Cloacimonadota bacterium]